MAEAYNPDSVDDGYEDEEEEIAAAEWNWGKKTVMVPNPWGRGVEESYDFDVTKSDKLFDFLLEKGQIKLPDNHVMLPPEQLKNKKFCKFHNATSHSTNECRIFWQHIQRAIQQRRLKFDTPRKMKVDDNPFSGDQNMVDARLLKGKTKVLTSTRSRETRTVDPEMQISVDNYREIKRHRDKQKSQYEQGETSKDGVTKPWVTSQILLNKWQRQKEKDYQRWLEGQEDQRQ